MPARRKRKKPGYRKTGNKKPGKKYSYIFFILLSLIIGTIYLLRTRYWSSEEKLSLMINNDSEIMLVVADPVLEEIYEIEIPGNTEIEVAGGLGRWKAKTLWALGEQEKLGGKLSVRSITMGLGLPVYTWADKPALGLVNTGLKPSLGALFSSYDTDLTFADKMHLFLFAIKIKNTKRVNLNLGKTNFLERGLLSDGSEGYEVSKSRPQNILSVFSEPVFSEGVVRVSIVDATGENGVAEKVSKVLETLGGKVSSIENLNEFEGVCKIKSKNKSLSGMLLKLFECEEHIIDEGQSFDVEMTLGKKFVKIY